MTSANRIHRQPTRRRGPRRPAVARWRHPIFVILVIGFLCSALGMWGLKAAGVSMPLWLDGKTGVHFIGESGSTELPTTLEEAALDFANHELQSALTVNLTYNVPLRAEGVLLNAGLQREAIQASNLVFRWPAYPTFYGSGFYVLDDYGTIVQDHAASALEPGWQTFGERLGAYADAHSDIEFLVYVAAESFDKDVNPLSELTTTTATTDDIAAIFDETLSGHANVSVLVQDYADPASFYEEYFAGDNHWNALGAVSAYNEIAEEMGLDALEVEGLETIPNDYMGSWSRVSLKPLVQQPQDITNDFSDLTIESQNGAYNAAAHPFWEGASAFDKYFNFIAFYYDLFVNNVSELTISAKEWDPDAASLLICDSYGYFIGRPLAEGTGKLDVFYWLSSLESGDGSLSELLERTGDKKVIMVAAPADYADQLTRYPHFFD